MRWFHDVFRKGSAVYIDQSRLTVEVPKVQFSFGAAQTSNASCHSKKYATPSSDLPNSRQNRSSTMRTEGLTGLLAEVPNGAGERVRTVCSGGRCKRL